MTIAEIIQPGDKVDISFVQNVEPVSYTHL